jgi:hypothetical protein
MKFKVGQIVYYKGLSGTVIEIISEKKKTYKLLVFNNPVIVNEIELKDA